MYLNAAEIIANPEIAQKCYLISRPRACLAPPTKPPPLAQPPPPHPIRPATALTRSARLPPPTTRRWNTFPRVNPQKFSWIPVK